VVLIVLNVVTWRGAAARAWRPYLAPCSPRGSGDAKAKATVKATAKAKATAIIWSLRPSGFAPAFGREGCASQRDIFRGAKAPRYLNGNGNGKGKGNGKGIHLRGTVDRATDL
jgi:hypothetical protein